MQQQKLNKDNSFNSLINNEFFQLAIIIVVGLLLFAPTLLSEFCRVDDLQMVEQLKKEKTVPWSKLFLPGSSGLYYRPLLMLSFYADRFIFGLSSFSMHLHNILLHIINAILLFYISNKILIIESKQRIRLPLLVALIFLAHPITTESINWISGRTDILASVFILGSTLLLLQFIINQQRIFLYSAFFMFVVAVLCKEFVLAFFPGFILLATCQKAISNIKSWLYCLLLAMLAVAMFFGLRSLAFTSNLNNISTTLLVIFNTPQRTAELALTAIGFYTKKLFIPVPLNFAIYEVNALYIYVAIPVILFLIYLLWKRSLQAIFFVTGILLFTPALLIALNQIAWTPFAERYIYLTVAFVIVSVMHYFADNLVFGDERLKIMIILLLLGMCFTITLQRNIIWMTANGIVSDTVKKSPESYDMKLIYASLLLDADKLENAKEVIDSIKTPPGMFYDERGDLFEVALLLKLHKREQAITLLETVTENTKFKSEKSVNNLIELLQEDAKKCDLAEQNEIYKKIYQLRQKHYRATRNIALLFNLYQEAKQAGDTKMSARYFDLYQQNNSIRTSK